MSYLVLARKWRPKRFQEMVGQKVVLQMLKNALDSNRLHHAYLFTGTRGIGKTTLARIFAKSLNCEKGVSSDPCGKCANCLAIDNDSFIDVIEIDAASRTKVEDTREILENVQYMPGQGRFKVYIIDEIHMLSGHSFNALLKTLEEPPSYVKFLLATTDPHKLPITVLSRCLQFHLKTVSVSEITDHLAHILKNEKIAFEPEALTAIAQNAGGSVRDALSLLDQAISLNPDKVTNREVQDLLGLSEADTVWQIIAAIAANDVARALEVVENIDQACDYARLLEELLSAFHAIAMAGAVPGASAIEPQIAELAASMKPEDVQLCYEITACGRRDLTLAPTPKMGFEMTLLRIFAFYKDDLNIDNKAKLAVKKSRVTQQTVVPDPQPATTEAVEKIEAPEPIISDWGQLIASLKLTGMSKSLANNCSMRNFTNNRLELDLASKKKALLSDIAKNKLQEALHTYFKRKIELVINLTGEADETSPAFQAQQQKTADKAEAIGALQQDPNVQHIIDTCGAKIDEDTVLLN